MKAAYGIFNNNIFRISPIQDIISTEQFLEPSTQSVYNQALKEFSAKINLVRTDGGINNEDLYNEVIETIKTKKISSIPQLGNRYKMILDYKLTDWNRCNVIDEGSVTKVIDASDVYIPLGVGEKNNMDYRVGKRLNSIFEFIYKQPNTPYGINGDRNEKLILEVSNIKILQNSKNSHFEEEGHGSLGMFYHKKFKKPYPRNDEYITIYDSNEEGVEIQPFNIDGFRPRKVYINISIILNNYLYAYSDEEINNYLTINENSANTGDIINGDGSSTDISGSDTETLDPNNNKVYQIYSRCSKNTTGALLVVDDNLGGNSEEEINTYSVLDYKLLNDKYFYAFKDAPADADILSVSLNTGDGGSNMTIEFSSTEGFTVAYKTARLNGIYDGITVTGNSIVINTAFLSKGYNTVVITDAYDNLVVLVIKNEDNIFNENTMIKYKDISRYITDISVGEYVVLDSGVFI